MQHYVVGKWHNPFIYESRCFYWIFLLSLLNLYNTFIMVYQIFLIYFKTSTSIFIKNSIKKRNKKEKKMTWYIYSENEENGKWHFGWRMYGVSMKHPKIFEDELKI